MSIINLTALGLTVPHLAVLALPESSSLFSLTLATATKCLPIAYLARDAYSRNASVGAGLALGMIGDAFLCIDHHGYFAQGLGCFLLGHLAYLRSLHMRNKDTPLAPVVGAAFAGAGAVVLRSVLLPKVPAELRVPVSIYVTTILALGWRSAARLLRANKHKENKSEISKARVGFAGAISFIVSDLVLALDTFVSPVPFARWIVMGTYYAAQLAIAASA
ncbi:Lysoplasmalogenase-like protein tmem86a [Chytriomyces hyalinus]|nr:Lysoplasmalogenase-like protein tmem86a [Chytriomyces hyalinus]